MNSIYGRFPHLKKRANPGLAVILAVVLVTSLSACTALAPTPNRDAPEPNTADAVDTGATDTAQLLGEVAALSMRVEELEARLALLEQTQLDSSAAGTLPPSPETQIDPQAVSSPIPETIEVETTDSALTSQSPGLQSSPSETSLSEASTTEAPPTQPANEQVEANPEPILIATATPTPTALSAGAPVSEQTATTDTPDTINTTDTTVQWDAARNHLGETVTVCGPVVAAQFAQQTNGQPTFLNIGQAFPAPERFQVVIWGDQRANFPTPPETAYQNAIVCVTGQVHEFRGTAEITIRGPQEIRVVNE